MYKIEKGIKRPDWRRSKYPLGEMDVGDSFFVGPEDMNKARTNAHVYGKKHNKVFRTAKEGDGIRIWRIK